MRVIFIMTLSTLFTNFTEIKRMSLGSKYDETNDFYILLNAFINTNEATTSESNNRSNRILSNVKQLCNKYLDTYKKYYNSEKLKDEEKRVDYKGFEINDNKIKNQNQLKRKRPRQKILME